MMKTVGNNVSVNLKDKEKYKTIDENDSSHCLFYAKQVVVGVVAVTSMSNIFSPYCSAFLYSSSQLFGIVLMMHQLLCGLVFSHKIQMDSYRTVHKFCWKSGHF